ncbi:fimbria/pilus periplasmic chaperone [Escherichia coli]
MLRILKTEGGVPLPEDRESLFWLNVQDLPKRRKLMIPFYPLP